MYWASMIKALPSLEDYRDMGIPLAASAQDLDRLQMIPRFIGISKWARNVQKMLHFAVDEFNQDRTAPTKITYTDALWGRIVASTRTFNSLRATSMAPIVDMINHSGDEDNVTIFDDVDIGALSVVAIKDVKAGDELKFNYGPGAPAEDMVRLYGVHEGNGVGEKWPAAECEKLQYEHLGQNGGAMLRTLGKLVKEHCDSGSWTQTLAPAAANPHSESLTKESATNLLAVWLLPRTCLPTESIISRVMMSTFL
eukprot:gnl/MRDRNA2_/MRDRNA2_312418_c0_seq1.p1 gnl/MRDRNA2_/MRDRNA2_312418_c0~~gnl/MRDRNA2_/MRDRNA2_312418_c0_seq1.p1  ORF type:complete len:253 (-),score=44.31 gnl/MRDRNA2_/MRDRNA2_312418_c0_seq1:9-767(-)